MKSVYLIDYHQFTRLNLISPLLDPSISFMKLKNILEQQGGSFLEINDSSNLERIEANNSNGIIYQYAINKISVEQFTNAMCILFQLDNLQFIRYWENSVNIEDLSLLALEELAQLQQSSEIIVHLFGNLTPLQADALNVKIAFTGLINVEHTCSYTENTLLKEDYVTKVVAEKYPNTEYEVIDLRSKGMLTPDFFRQNPEATTETSDQSEPNAVQTSNAFILTP